MTDSEVKAATSDSTAGKMIFQPILEDGVFRFDCSANDREAVYPSLSFINNKSRDVPVMSNKTPSYIPSFECRLGQQIVKLEWSFLVVKFPAGTSFYGTGEVSGQLERTGKRVFTWNTDAWGYGPETTSLYQSHPWVLAVLPNGEALGILADTTRRCEIDLRTECRIQFISLPSFPVITFGPFSSPTAVLVSLSHAIGTVFMPPKWSLGYHQCRWSYDSQERVLEERFPDAKSLVKDLQNIGFKAIWMLDPGIKQEEGYFVYDSGSKHDVWIQKADGKPFVGDVWPGPCVFPDFTQSKARAWWANLVKDFISNGVDGIWNDMNEPAIFKTVTKTMPESNIHRGDNELGGCQSHAHYHNVVYGMLMARSTYEGMGLADRRKRPFVLTRAGFIGSQSIVKGARCTLSARILILPEAQGGKSLETIVHINRASFEVVLFPLCLWKKDGRLDITVTMGLSGQPLSGPDIGGFAGNATPKLFGRWLGFGAMFPFCRGHSETGTIDHEPWSFGKECEEVCRLALKRRYRLIPHIYTLFYMAHTRGTPVATPAFFAGGFLYLNPKDPNLRTLDSCFLLGPLLVYSSIMPDLGSDKLQPLLPKGIWLSFDFDDSHPDLPALYLQGGYIIPFGPPHQHVGESNPLDDLTLIVALDEHGKAKGSLFEDDGDGYGFTEGEYLFTHYVAELESSVVTVKVYKTEGLWKRPNRRLHVQLLIGEDAMLDAWGNDGEDLQIEMPSEIEVSKLISSSKEHHRLRLESIKHIPDAEDGSGHKGGELSRTPIELANGDWSLKIVPWIGGRIISMVHLPSGIPMYPKI
ncbi:hypothetical protein Godav_013622 [Gossypium davidsonii]|uniref:Glycoside hydrolase family 31 N-terminal domain-containing protein n=1 Tax=Gossypium davidsonii TaxID=34287 RepID=A0A7J8RHP9_GOSDV|nr:hypothetical protein [Gossypium davidsonii]